MYRKKLNAFNLNSKYLLILLAFMLATVFIVQFDNASMSQKKEELKKINKQLDGLAGKKNEILKESSALEKQIYSLELNINSINEKIDTINKKINLKEVEINNTQVELENVIIKSEEQDEQLRKRLRTMYKFGNHSYLEVILNSNNLSDLMTNLDRVQLVLEQDKKMLETLEKYRKEVSEFKEKLATEKKELQNFKKQNEAHLADVKSKQKQLQSQKLVVATDLAAVGRAMDELEADSRRVTQLLKQMAVTRSFVGGKFSWPLPKNRTYITSPFGYRIHPIYKYKKLHSGTDIGAPRGTPIYAALGGQVITARYLGGYGNCVMIDHGGGYVTLYAHASKLRCSQGQWVEKGDIVAEVGSTGASTGNHLHFEIRKNGDFTDPMNYFQLN